MNVLGRSRFACPPDAQNPQVGIPHLRVSRLFVRIERYGCLRALEAASLRSLLPTAYCSSVMPAASSSSLLSV